MRELQTRGQLQVASNLTAPPDGIAAEVGLELATLLHAARHDNGRVICVLPISKVGSLAEQTADTSQYDDLIHSTMDLCTLLHGSGKIAETDFQPCKVLLEPSGPNRSAPTSHRRSWTVLCTWTDWLWTTFRPLTY